MFTATYKDIKNFASEIFKLTRSGKPDVEEDPRIEGYVNIKIQEKYNPTPKTLAVYDAGTLLPITENMQGKMNAIVSAIYKVKSMKESLAGAVIDGVCYQYFKTFNA